MSSNTHSYTSSASTGIRLAVACLALFASLGVACRPGSSPLTAVGFYIAGPDGDPELVLSGEIGSPGWTPDGKQISFTRIENGRAQLYVVDSDGANRRRLLSSLANDSRPILSPDGNKYLFFSDRSGTDQVFVMNADGTGVRRLTTGPSSSFNATWSPDGGHIAYSTENSETGHDLFIADSSGMRIQRLTDGPSDEWYPAWSPDGSRIAFMNGSGCLIERGTQSSPCNPAVDIYVVNADGSHVRRVTHDGLSKWPSWTHDGRLLYTRNGAIYTADPDGAEASLLVAGANYQPQQSPDGRQLLFSRIDFLGETKDALPPKATSVDVALVAPNAAEPAVDVAVPPELVAIGDCATLRGELLVWLPATLGAVSPDSPIPNLAARHCMHVVGINYPTLSDAIDVCRFESSASACYEAFRLEKLEGIDHDPKLAIPPNDSLEGRLIRLLAYLSTERPDEGWDQFMREGEVRWELVTIGGVSQGAGMAAFVGKKHPVRRVVMLAAWADVAGGDSGPVAEWIGRPGSTPPERYFGFAHERDGAQPTPNYLRTWTALGLDAFGPAADVDGGEPPFDASHQLVTSLHCTSPETTRCSHDLVNRPELSPVLTPVWEYLLGLR